MSQTENHGPSTVRILNHLDGDIDWTGVYLDSPQLRGIVAASVMAGTPVNVHRFPEGPDLPFGAEVVRDPSGMLLHIHIPPQTNLMSIPKKRFSPLPWVVSSIVENFQCQDRKGQQ